ncbi:hypothetical protein BJ684DRAFT_15340 [Piptocephalis cylindrospora]|uniref:UDENN domain-containing protein n=1 Tax=Piptocephalis cylindrospora TaxID=1907219 RepID=A0A4P9Y5L1_9FUNG|nr:hypothetical protein BJ684DRAFT_15340 [Piptocephalis cylindrospora]|eukprot:RKP14318.1 hypothetical protein BJ684DRAFT_15340 [Piptocephalis cylindrospora]
MHPVHAPTTPAISSSVPSTAIAVASSPSAKRSRPPLNWSCDLCTNPFTNQPDPDCPHDPPFPPDPIPTSPTSPIVSKDRHRGKSSADLDHQLLIRGFQRWCIAICIVTFDLEHGHTLESVHPSGTQLEEALRHNVCFSSFPDIGGIPPGDHLHSFRLRVHQHQSTYTNKEVPIMDDTAPDLEDHQYIHGHVLYRLKRTPSQHRGFSQRSIVLLTHHRLPGLFVPVTENLGKALLDPGKEGKFLVSTACRNIASWPSPKYGASYHLPILDMSFDVELPWPGRVQSLSRSTFDYASHKPSQQLLAGVYPNSYVLSFQGAFQWLWDLWELMILGEPILVMGATPGDAARGVYSLVDLICPLIYSGDWRPFLTIQDRDFKVFSNPRTPQGTVVLGASNRIVLEACGHFPHILYLGSGYKASVPVEPLTSSSPKPADDPPVLALPVRNSKSFAKVGLVTKHRRVVARDEDFLRSILSDPALLPGALPSEIYQLNDRIRGHFSDLTDRFLAPIHRYFSTLIPPIRHATTSTKPPAIRPFRISKFLDTVSDTVLGGDLRLRASFNPSARPSLYQSFLRSTNAMTWRHARSVAAESLVWRRWVQQLCDTNMKIWCERKGELEMVDMLARIQSHLIDDERAKQGNSGGARLTRSQRDRLYAHRDLITTRLPQDLKGLVIQAHDAAASEDEDSGDE